MRTTDLLNNCSRILLENPFDNEKNRTAAIIDLKKIQVYNLVGHTKRLSAVPFH